jgi:ABC-2 type transport system ATP-binding protein
LEEVEAVCSRAIIIAQGRILTDGTPTGLAARSRFHNAVRLDIDPANEARIRADLATLRAIAAIETVDDGRVLRIVPLNNRSIAGDIAELAERRRWRIGGFAVERGRLDDVFRAITTPAPAESELRRTLTSLSSRERVT